MEVDDNIPLVSNDIDQEQTFEDIIITYNDIIELVKAYNISTSETKKDNLKLQHLQNQINEFIIEIEHERDKLEDTINLLWIDVLQPFIEYETTMILYNDIVRIKSKFYEWIYNNTNVGKKINYIYDLLNNLQKYNIT